MVAETPTATGAVMPTTYTSDDVTPAMRYYLLAGEWAPGRIKGWVSLAQAGMFGQPTPEAVWTVHQHALVDEADRAGFRPFMLTKTKPRGPAFAQWQRAFLAEHSY